MMKKGIIALALLVVAVSAYAADRAVAIQLKNVAKGGGKVYVSIYNSESTYKASKQMKDLVLDPTSDVLTVNETLADGEYVVSAYQDTNGNNKLDTSIIGIPKEPVGICNYTGKGAPGGFKDLKTKVDKDMTIVVEMKKI